MAMTITEASEVMRLLDWITGKPGPSGRRMTDEGACKSASYLADRAHKPLMAGWTGQELEAAWTRRAVATVGAEGGESQAVGS